MACSYQQVLHDTAIRMNVLVGSQVAALAATYDTASLAAANFKSADWPFNSFRDAILMSEEMYAWSIAESRSRSDGPGDHIWRSYLAAVTASLASRASLPSLSSGGNQIIGAYGAVVDASDGTSLEPRSLSEVQQYVEETWRLYQLYFYNITGARIYHTRPGAVIEVCTYNRTTQLAGWNAAGNILLPDVMEFPYTAQAISLMVKDTKLESMPLAQYYTEYAAAVHAAIRAGRAELPKAA